MRAQESYRQSNVAAGTYGPFTLDGGSYQLALECTGTPAIALQQCMPNGSTFVALFGRPNTATPTTWIASGIASGVIITFDALPPGTYQVVISTSTANFFALTRIPLE